MTKIPVRFLRLFKSNEGLFEPISAFILIVVLAVGAVVSSNLVSQRTSQVSQASCPDGQQPCTDDPYGEPCGDNNTGVKVCHKKGCSVDGSSGASCSWGPGSYCDSCKMPEVVAPPPPPVIPEENRCGHCNVRESCSQGHWVGNDCCFHTELDCDNGCSGCPAKITPIPTLAPGERAIPTPDAGGELKCPCKPKPYCDPITGYWCGNDCRLHPGSKEDDDNCAPKPSPIRLPTATPIPTKECMAACVEKGYSVSVCRPDMVLNKYSCDTFEEPVCLIWKETLPNTKCAQGSTCYCANHWNCAGSHPSECSCCQSTLTTTPTSQPVNNFIVPTSIPTPTPAGASCPGSCFGEDYYCPGNIVQKPASGWSNCSTQCCDEAPQKRPVAGEYCEPGRVECYGNGLTCNSGTCSGIANDVVECDSPHLDTANRGIYHDCQSGLTSFGSICCAGNNIVECMNKCTLPKTCQAACPAGSSVAICNGAGAGADCTGSGDNAACTLRTTAKSQDCDECTCVQRFACENAPAECSCCPRQTDDTRTGCSCGSSADDMLSCGIGGLNISRCPTGQKCSGGYNHARCVDRVSQTSEFITESDTLSTFSGHGEASSPAKNAKITLKDPDGKKYLVKTDENGDYTITVPTDRVYDVTIESVGYKTLTFKWDSKMGLDYLMNFKLVKKDKPETGNFEIAEASGYRLLVGWNLISLPVQPKVQMKASGLLTEINRSGGLAVSVSRWQDGRWETYLAGLDKNDFAIEVGRAYFVENFNETQFRIEGEEITQPQTLILKPGWNAIGLPKTANCPANSCSGKAIMNLIDNQSSDSAKIFSQFESGLWQALSKEKEQFYGWDFAIKSNNGYFIKVNKSIQLLP